MKIVVLETLIVRREQDDASRTLSSTQTELLVENGQIIEPRTPVTKTQVLSVDNSVASIKSTDKDLRRLLLVSEKYEQKMQIDSKATVKIGEFIKRSPDSNANKTEKLLFSTGFHRKCINSDPAASSN